MPTSVVSFHFARKAAGSNSAPARNVKTIAPELARKVSHGSFAPSPASPKKRMATVPAATPMMISTNAVEIRSQPAMKVERSARASQIVAIVYVCSIGSNLLPAPMQAPPAQVGLAPYEKTPTEVPPRRSHWSRFQARRLGRTPPPLYFRYLFFTTNGLADQWLRQTRHP